MRLAPSDLDLRDLNTAHDLVTDLDDTLMARHYDAARIDLATARRAARGLANVLAAIERRQAKRREQRKRRGSVLKG